MFYILKIYFKFCFLFFLVHSLRINTIVHEMFSFKSHIIIIITIIITIILIILIIIPITSVIIFIRYHY